MTIKERVLASRLIEKIENHKEYATQISLNYRIAATGVQKRAVKAVESIEKN